MQNLACCPITNISLALQDRCFQSFRKCVQHYTEDVLNLGPPEHNNRWMPAHQISMFLHMHENNSDLNWN